MKRKELEEIVLKLKEDVNDLKEKVEYFEFKETFLDGFDWNLTTRFMPSEYAIYFNHPHLFLEISYINNHNKKVYKVSHDFGVHSGYEPNIKVYKKDCDLFVIYKDKYDTKYYKVDKRTDKLIDVCIHTIEEVNINGDRAKKTNRS